MPNFPGTPGSVIALPPRERIALFNAEPAAGQCSIAVAPAPVPGSGIEQRVFTVWFAVAPAAVVVIQGSNVDADAQYQTLHTTSNLQTDYYLDYGVFAFYRVKLVSYSAGGALTVTVQ